jgi:dCMP deaminase
MIADGFGPYHEYAATVQVLQNPLSAITPWDIKYLRLARFIANEWSKDPSTKTGAVIVDQWGDPVSMGVNGLPKGVDYAPERLLDRELKYKSIIHCERNALIFAKRDLHGCTLYTWPFMSCSGCASLMIQAGIVRHVAPGIDHLPADLQERWKVDMELAHDDFKRAGVVVVLTPELAP